MNIFRREVKANLRSLVIWAVIVLLFMTVGFGKFAAYEGNPELLRILDELPPAVMSAFNMEAFNLTTITGFYGVMYSYFALILSIAAAMWGSDIIAKEERDKTVEFSLTLPVRRATMVTAKTAAVVVNCAGLLLITWAGILFNAAGYEPDSAFYEFVGLGMIALFILQMVFLAIGIFIGCALQEYRRAGSLAVAVLLGTYFLSIITGLVENLDFLKYFSPFTYFNPATLLHESQIDLGYVGLSAAIVALAMAGAYLTYARRDLYI